MDDYAGIVRTVRDVQIVNYSTVAALTLGLYDILLVADLEMEHIWSTRWTYVKGLYILSRYYGLANLLVMFVMGARFQDSLDVCRTFLRFLILGGVLFQVCIINVVEILRLYFLFERKKLFLVLVGIVTFAKMVAIYVIAFKLAWVVVADTFIGTASLPIRGCHSKSHPTYPLVLFGIGLTNQFFLFLLQMLKLHIDIYRGWRTKSFADLHPTLKVFCRSGTLWFFNVVAVSVVYAVCAQVFDGPLQNVTIPWLTLVFSMTGSRLILKLKRGGGTTREMYDTVVATSLAFSPTTAGTESEIDVYQPEGVYRTYNH